MHVRCPHCHNPLELVDDISSEILCTSCGSSFSLVSGDTTHKYEPRGRTIAHFELVEQLGIGHFGAVWKAKDTELDRLVAIKLPRNDQLEPAERELFLREARAAAQLRHPGIVSVHEVGRDGDTVYIVSDYIAGANLKEWLTAQRLTPREAAQLIVTIAEALDHAHQVGVVHRDLKPGNILMDLDGRPHIADFGLAKREAGEITMTVEGRVLGTPAYMPPEQARGEGHNADRRADIYSLGVILFELLTGELPFRGDQRMLIVQILREEPPNPRKLNSRIPRDLETITLKCLQKEPARRYQTAAELAADLNRSLAGEAIRARPVGRFERGWRWAKRNRSLTTTGAIVAILLSTVAVVSSLSAIRINAERQRADHKTTEALVEKTRADEKTAEALAAAETAKARTESLRQAVYVSNMHLADRTWETGTVEYLDELLEQCLPHGDERDLRGWEWFYLRRLCAGDLRTLKLTSTVTSVAFSPDGRRMASASYDQTIKLWDSESGVELRTLKGHTDGVNCVAYSPDGRRLASASDDQTIKLWDSESGVELRTLKGHTNLVRSVAFSPDGRRLASASSDSTIKLWDLESGVERRTLKGHTDGVNCVAFSPDGRRLASASDDRTIKLWDSESGVDLRTLEENNTGVNCVAFDPHGQWLASAGYDQTIKIWDWHSGAGLWTLEGHTNWIDSVSFSPDGRRLASASSDQTIKLWDVASKTELRTMKGHTSRVTSVAFSPDGQRLASASFDLTIKLWDVESGTNPLTFNGHTIDIHSIAFSPDGRRVASASFDQTVKLWDVDSRAEVRTFVGHTNAVLSVAFSPDGQRLASASDDQTIRLWDSESGAGLRTLKGHADRVNGVAFSPDGRRLASASYDQTIKLWDSESGVELRTLKGHTSLVRSVAFSPDGRRLASASSDSNIKLWDSESGAELRTLKGHTQMVNSVVFSPDGQRLASASDDQTIKLWDSESGALLRTLKGHTRVVNSVAFSLEGRRIVSASYDGIIRLWDANSGAEVWTLKDGGSSAAFSPDGLRLASANRATIGLWDATDLSDDNKMAHFLVDQLYNELGSATQLAAVVAAREQWPATMRSAAKAYIERVPWEAIRRAEEAATADLESRIIDSE